MGIRLASERHTNVVVMAPALTETAQNQSLKFVTSPSRSPSLSLKNHFKKKQNIVPEEVKTKLANGSQNFTGMNGHSPGSKTTYSINGLAKNLKNEFLSLNKKKEESSDETTSSEANYSITQIGGYMMNSGFSGENNQDMGLQKSNKDLCDGEKIPPEVDQLIKNFVVMNSDELSSNSELNQNVEEIIKAITNFDSTSNDIESGPSGDNMFPDVSAALSSFERGLFNEVDIMNMCVDESLVAVNKDTLICDRIEELRKRQLHIGKTFDSLLKRTMKFAAITVGKQAAEEIMGVLEYSSNLLEASSRLRGFSSGDNDSDIQFDVKSVSFSNMSLFMRQMEHAVNQQTNTMTRNSLRLCKYFGSGSSSNDLISTSNGVRSSLPGSVLPPYPSKIQRELATTSCELTFQMAEIQKDIDSDVTESSSGSESSDEFVSYNNPHQHQLSISKRAAWRWAEERARIASRWSWLQSQIAELEYKIRQQNEHKKKILQAKGPLVFQTEQQSPPNGRRADKTENGGDSCSRSRGLVSSSFRKRRLLQLSGLHRTSKKAALMSDIRCSCSSTIPGCALCTGRPQPAQPTAPLVSLSVPQRLACLDPGFHPVLSFSHDTGASWHYDALMKCSEWQGRAGRVQTKASASAGPAASEEKNRVQRPPPSLHQVVDLQRSKAAALAVSVKLRRKLGRGKRRRRGGALERHRQRRKQAGEGAADAREGGPEDSKPGVGEAEPTSPSPVSSPALSHPPISLSKEKDSIPHVKRKRENSYDIDNIVIPYSMASSTRLEKLNYKEIPTPKWRVIKKDDVDVVQLNGIIRRSSQDKTEIELDKSREAATSRHEKCRLDERKKFLSYLKLPGGMWRGRAQRRTDSRADSSGPNTPDGMSPRDDGLEDVPPVASPPQPPSCENSETGRRRTISSSQIPLVIAEVDPYNRRDFPLDHDNFKEMVESADYEHHTPNNSSYQNSIGGESVDSASTDSAESYATEDPNDPEWTSGTTTCDRRGTTTAPDRRTTTATTPDRRASTNTTPDRRTANATSLDQQAATIATPDHLPTKR